MKKQGREPVIGVVGGRRARKGELEAAERVGRLIALSGAVLVTGGLGGVMEAASRGAAGEGGLVVGILPHDDAHAANKFVGVAIATGMGIGRNVVIARTADALVAVGGGYGTLSEIAFALQMGKPVVGIGSWDIPGVAHAADAADAVAQALGRIHNGQH